MQGSRTLVVLACLIGGCTLGPDYKRPPFDVPAAYRTPAAAEASPAPVAAAPAAASAAGSARLAQADAALAAVPTPAAGDKELLDTSWWSAFGDPKLDELIRTAIEENKDLRIAADRIEQFDAYLQITKSAGLPQVGYRAERTRDTLSQNRQVPLAAGVNPVGNNYSVALQSSWELDLWGKLSRADEASLAELVASEENRRDLMLSVVSQVVAGYIRLLAADRELELVRVAIEANREAVRLAESSFNSGGSSEVPVVHALAELQQRQAEVPAKEAEIAALENALSILIGHNPGTIVRGKPMGELVMPKVPGGLPAELLAQRPDIRKTEQDLIAANAKIGVAKAQYFPQIALTASSGFASTDLSTLSNLTSNFGSFGVTLLGPIFTSGRTAGQVREAEAVQKQAVTSFLRSLQGALREVDDALTAYRKISQQDGIRALQIGTLREQLDLARKRYDGGFTSYFPVLDAAQALTAGELLQNEGRREQFKSLIAVYKAMGGGWSLPDVTAPRANPPKTTHE